MKELTSRITIGQYQFKGVYLIRIKKSIHSFRNTATISLPASARLKSAEQGLPSLQTAKQFNEGDWVKIELGYDGEFRDEFEGFVSRVNFSQPVEIECEGYSWLMRKECNLKGSFPLVKLKDLMQFIVDKVNDGRDADHHITLSPDIPDLSLKQIVINNASGTQVIEYIKGLFNGILQAFWTGPRELYIGLSYMDVVRQTAKYRLNWNTLPPNNLKYHRAEDTQVKIEIVYRDESGKQVTTETGEEGGIVRRDNLTVVTDNKTIERIAEAKLAQERWNGYEGALITLLQPYCQPGFRAEVEDRQYEERQGAYFVESTTVTYGTNGAKRIVELGQRLTE